MTMLPIRKLDSSVAARLGMCAAALAGTAATVTDANAVVVRSTTPISVPNTIDGVYINFLTGGTSSSATAGWDFNPYSSNGTLLFYWGGDVGGSNGGVASTTTGPYLDLAVGSVISSASTFSASANGVNNETSAFLVAGNHTLGFRFTNESTGAINYGYANITTSAAGFPVTISSYAYENSGGAITVSAVPEPESVLMFSMGALALGAGSLRRMRRERRERRTTAH